MSLTFAPAQAVPGRGPAWVCSLLGTVRPPRGRGLPAAPQTRAARFWGGSQKGLPASHSACPFVPAKRPAGASLTARYLWPATGRRRAMLCRCPVRRHPALSHNGIAGNGVSARRPRRPVGREQASWILRRLRGDRPQGTLGRAHGTGRRAPGRRPPCGNRASAGHLPRPGGNRHRRFSFPFCQRLGYHRFATALLRYIRQCFPSPD